MKKFVFFLAMLAVLTAGAAIPDGYYNNANNKCGATLKTALRGIIYTHTKRTYDNLWTDFRQTDKRSDGKVWDMYSGTSNYTFGTDQVSTTRPASSEGAAYNREHSVPASWFGEGEPMYTDLHHLVPTDGYVNNQRSNLPFGETSSPTYISNGGFSKVGPSSLSDYSGTVFEPNDEYKGDFARIYFYMVTCYENQIQNWSSAMFVKNTYPSLASWAVTLLLRWAKEDPVSQKEIDRNNAVYSIQGNRNPFVDFEGLEQYVWGNLKTTNVNLTDYTSPYGTSTTDPTDPTEPTTGEGIFERITSTADLETGKRYLIVWEGTGNRQGLNVAMGNVISSNRRMGVSVTISNNQIDLGSSVPENLSIFTLGGNEGAYTFQNTTDANNLYLALTKEENKIHTATSATATTAQWGISFSGNNAIITNGNYPDRKIQGNLFSNVAGFACYTSNQSSIQLYKETVSEGGEEPVTTVEAPTFSPASGTTLTAGESVTISCATEGATIHYSVNGGTELTAASPASVTLNTEGNVSISAYATLSTAVSSSANATYTVTPAPVVGETKTYYRKITSTADLETGKNYLILSSNHALAAQNGSSYRKVEDVVIDHCSGLIELAEGATVTPLTLGSSASGYTLKCANETGSKYISYSGSGTNLTTSTTTDNKAKWTFAFDGNGNVTISNVSATSRNIRYRGDLDVIRFAAYNNAEYGQAPELYKEVELPATATQGISVHQYATRYDERSYVMPAGLTGSTLVAVNGTTLTAGTTYTAGQTVPGGTPILLYGDNVTASTNFTLSYTTTADGNTDSNLLHGSATTINITPDNNYYFYKLTTKDGEQMGFYWGETDGSAFTSQAGKCWLAVPKTAFNGQAVQALFLQFDDVTGLDNAAADNAGSTQQPAYDLIGRRLFRPVRGLQIVGGRKVWVK